MKYIYIENKEKTPSVEAKSKYKAVTAFKELLGEEININKIKRKR